MNDYIVVGHHFWETTCIVCNGSGRLGESQCWDCGGKGKFATGCHGIVTQSQQYGHAFCEKCGAIPAEAVSR